MADAFDMVKTIVQRVQETLSVRTVYGDPITAGNVTVVPVARVVVLGGGGGGGGSGRLPGSDDAAAKLGSSGAGGAGLGYAQPIGFIEITDGGSRWVPVERGQSEQMVRALKVVARAVPGGRRALALGALAMVAQVLFDRLGGGGHAPLGAPPAQG